MKRHVSYYGFSLIELLVAVSLIAILSTLGISGFQAVTRGGRDALRKSELEQIRSALEMYRSETGSYPAESTTCLPDLTANYINPYPVDTNDPTLRYCYIRTSALMYQLCAHLENGGTQDLCGATTACGQNCNYQVINP